MRRDFLPAHFDDGIRELLRSQGLPTADLESGTEVSLFVAGQEEQLLGVVGIQILGSVALLRSLAVISTERGKGLGEALVRCAEQHADSMGVHAIYLLTTSAESFFLARGYRAADRKDAPAAIARSSQFSSLCPSSSAFMSKALRSVSSRTI